MDATTAHDRADCAVLCLLWCGQDALKSEAAELGKDYLADAGYEEAIKTSFADLFKKVRRDTG